MLGKRTLTPDESERIMDLNNPEHQEKVQSFCNEWFPKLEAKEKGKNAASFFSCCLSFCARNYTEKASHQQSLEFSYSEFKRKWKVTTAESMTSALFAILEERDNEDHHLVFPSYNKEHIEGPSEEHTLLTLRSILVEKDRKIIHLQNEIHKKNDEIEKVRRESVEVVAENVWIAKEKVRVEDENDKLKSLNSFLESMIQKCESCKTDTANRRLNLLTMEQQSRKQNKRNLNNP
jgi:hypothetical protein